MNKIDDILGQLIRKRDAYNDTMKIIHDLQNDPYFVFFASDSDRMGDDELEEVNVWFFDNDIVRKPYINFFQFVFIHPVRIC